MVGDFDILKYMAGLLGGYVFDKAVLERIAYERGVVDVTDYEELDRKTRDLLLADLAWTAYYSPNVWASSSQSHGSYSKSIGQQTIYTAEKEKLLNIFAPIYEKYEDEKLEQINENTGTLQWLDI